MVDALAAPGTTSSLVLRIAARPVEGEAFLNGAPLALGWIVLVPDPSAPGDAFAGRVRDGRFTVPVPARGDAAWAALVPERDPLPWPRFDRGECLPVAIPEWRNVLRKGFLSIRYFAHDFVLEVSPRFLGEHPDAEIEFPHHLGNPGGFRKVLRKEPLDRSPFRLDLLPPGRFGFKVTWRGGSRLVPEFDFSRDVRIVLPD
jgi:hypothetical protein